jgi:hypothetical protein
MATAVRRVVLLAVVRPVLEHGSTVWCTTAAQQARLELVQTRVLQRIVRLPYAVADDVLAVCQLDGPAQAGVCLPAEDDGRRSLARPGGRSWRARACRRCTLVWSVAALERAVDIKVPALAAAGVGKAVFKRVAGEVVRARDVRAVRRRVHGVAPPAGAGRPSPAHESAPAIPRGPLTESQRFKFICRAGVMPTARRQWQQGRASTAKCLLCPEGLEETMHHALLACSAFATERDTMWAELEAEVGVAVVAAVRDMHADRQLAALLGDAQWGGPCPGSGWHCP